MSLAPRPAQRAPERGGRGGRAALTLPLGPAVPEGLERGLHVTAAARDRFRVPPEGFGLGGRLVSVDLRAAARVDRKSVV